MKTILACSGGTDSVYLLHRLIEQGRRPIVAHFNHRLRGPESEGDEMFVRTLAKQNGLQCEVGRANVSAWAKTHKKSLEEAGRILRYRFFEKIRQKHHATAILTAHHLNDNLETVLMNQERGANLKGQIGMLEKNGWIERPLLNTTKEEILLYLKEHQLPHREDASNADTRFRRNHVRHHVIPALLKKNPRLLQDFKKTRVEALKKYTALKHHAVGWFSHQLAHRFAVKDFIKCSKPFQSFLLQHLYETTYGSTQGLTSKQVEEVHTLILSNHTGKQKRFGKKIVMRIEYGEVRWDKSARRSRTTQLLHFDADRIPQGIIHTRSWKPGDRFQPSGMTGTKKVQDHFTDLKIPRDQRNRIPIFTTHDDRIIAVGDRVDERYKATPATSSVLKVRVPSAISRNSLAILKDHG